MQCTSNRMKFPRCLPLVALGAISLAVGWFYHWTVGAPPWFAGEQKDYYNLLVDGFQSGQLAMKVAVKSAVPGQMPDPFLLDASLHEGRYYLYFGVTPALLLFWPWTALTGHDFSEPLAAVVLSLIAIGFGAAWLRVLQRRFFPDTGSGPWLASILALALASGLPVVLRRPLFYEVAILSGLACSFAALLCMTLALLRRERAPSWLALASMGVGFAAGSRPSLIPGALAALGLVTVATAWRARAEGRSLRTLVAGFLPAAVCLAGLAGYNWARFGSPFEFGLHYQQGSNAEGFPFTFTALWRNLGVYYFAPPEVGWFFPYIAAAVKPLGSYPEEVHGQFLTLPLFGLAAGLAVARIRRQGWNTDLAIIITGALVWAGCALLVVAMAPPHSNRYQLDFHPVFLVLALFGTLALWERERSRWLAGAGLVWLLLVAGHNVLASFHAHGFFRGSHPESYETLARTCDKLVWPLQRLLQSRPGAREVAVRFADSAPGSLQPLLIAGRGRETDALLIRYVAPGRGRLVFDHAGHGRIEGEDFDLHPGRVRWLHIRTGTLYPPEGHPWYDDKAPGLARWRHRVSVQVDGIERLGQDSLCWQASPGRFELGRGEERILGASKFAGEIHRVRSIDEDSAWLEAMRQAQGMMLLQVALPRDRFGAVEPLVVTGTPQRREFVGVRYIRDGALELLLLPEGAAEPLVSAPIEWDYARPLELIIGLGSLGQSKGAFIDAAGRTVLRGPAGSALADPIRVFVGCQPWTVLPVARPLFGGRVLGVARDSEGNIAMRRARQAMLTGGTVELEITLPAVRPELGQPLVTTGFSGRGDGLFYQFQPDGRVRFGFDHWGSVPVWSEPVVMALGQTHRVRVTLGANALGADTVRGRIRVWLDSRSVLDFSADLFACQPDQVMFGENHTGMSTSQARLEGRIDSILATEPLP